MANWREHLRVLALIVSVVRVLLNIVVYAFWFLVCTRLLYAGQPPPSLMCAAFLLASIGVGLWSNWWDVVVPAALGYLWGLGAFKWAIHLTDTLGEYAPPMSRYVLSPSPSEIMWSVVAAAAASVGWWISTFVKSRLLSGSRGRPDLRKGPNSAVDSP